MDRRCVSGSISARLLQELPLSRQRRPSNDVVVRRRLQTRQMSAAKRETRRFLHFRRRARAKPSLRDSPDSDRRPICNFSSRGFSDRSDRFAPRISYFFSRAVGKPRSPALGDLSAEDIVTAKEREERRNEKKARVKKRRFLLVIVAWDVEEKNKVDGDGGTRVTADSRPFTSSARQ